jgi:hypothetical protein
MSNSVTPLNLTAAALTLLQARSVAALSSVKTAATERQAANQVAEASQTLAQQAASGTAIPRGQILNILV